MLWLECVKKNYCKIAWFLYLPFFLQRRRRKINGTASTECVESSIKNDLADAISTPFSKAVYNLQNQNGFCCSEYEIVSILQGPLLFFAILICSSLYSLKIMRWKCCWQFSWPTKVLVISKIMLVWIFNKILYLVKW